MAIIRINTAEGGTDGVAVSIANSGGASGDPFEFVDIDAGERFEYDDDGPKLDTMSFKIEQVTATSTSMFGQWRFDTDILAVGTTFIAKLPFYRTMYARPAYARLLQLGEFNDPDGVSMGIRSDGTVRINTFDGADIDVGAVAIPLNQWARLELEVDFLDDVGNAEGRLYDAEVGGTLLETLSLTGVSTGGADPEKFANYGYAEFTTANRDHEGVPWWMDNVTLETPGEDVVPSIDLLSTIDTIDHDLLFGVHPDDHHAESHNLNPDTGIHTGASFYKSGASPVTISDADFTTPANGMVAITYETDTGNQMIWARSNGVWGAVEA